MKNKTIKALGLIVLVVALLTTAIVISPKVGDHTTDDPTVPVVNPNPILTPTEAPTAAPENGWVTENGENHYYINGVLQKDTVVGDDTSGYFYVDVNGARDDGYCNGLTIDGVRWNIIEGKATPVNENDGGWDDALHSALLDVGRCTTSDMTREEKLRASFLYIQDDNHYLEGVLHDPPYNEMDWPVVCANDLFKQGMGDCFSYGAAFAFYGKAIGFENCYACNTGGHGWAEIDGKAYDPEFDMHNHEYSHYGVAPEDENNVAYFTSITEGVDWMYIKV